MKHLLNLYPGTKFVSGGHTYYVVRHEDIYQVVEGDAVLFQGTIANCMAYIQAKNLLLL